MTIGIVAPLEDGVMLIADGIRVSLTEEGEPIVSEDVSKIDLVNSNLAVISFGISEVTQPSLQLLQQAWAVTPNPHLLTVDQVKHLIDQALGRIWGALTFAPNIDLSRPDHIAGFAFGGVTPEGPIVGLVLRSHTSNVALLGSSDPRARIVAAFDITRAQQIYRRYEQSEPVLTNSRTETLDQIKKAFIRAGANAIREVGIDDKSVGGTIRYLNISSMPPHVTEGVWNE